MEKLTKEALKKVLTPLQYYVTQLSGTERPFKNEYYNFFQKGIYRCLICKIPLFASETKFDHGCGWPAFYNELKEAKITRVIDKTHGMTRVEVRCSQCDSHLGHLFEDGPKDKTGIRYCINSASLKFEEI